MSDFASALMLQVIQAGMNRLGLSLREQRRSNQATIPLNLKQALVNQVIEQRGFAAVIELGQGAHDLELRKLMPALAHDGQPFKLLSAWLRLERYLHSKHRIIQTITSDTSVVLEHVSLRAGLFPSPAEDLVVLGVMIALLEQIGCQNVRAWLDCGQLVWPPAGTNESHRKLTAACANRKTGIWRIQWGSVQKPLLVGSSETDGNDSNLPTNERVQRLLARTMGSSLSLEQAALQLGHSKRTLQRKLNVEGTRYADLVAMVRSQRAAQMLSATNAMLAQVGFSCGYTDQAHFCRDFKRLMGMSPAQYREIAR
jgi:AraC-like DNA-binding protein